MTDERKELFFQPLPEEDWRWEIDPEDPRGVTYMNVRLYAGVHGIWESGMSWFEAKRSKNVVSEMQEHITDIYIAAMQSRAMSVINEKRRLEQEAEFEAKQDGLNALRKSAESNPNVHVRGES